MDRPLFVRDRFVVVLSFDYNLYIISYLSFRSCHKLRCFFFFFLRKTPSGIIMTLVLVITLLISSGRLITLTAKKNTIPFLKFELIIFGYN
jgi:hypothetical protein